jgi:hypothetical protein
MKSTLAQIEDIKNHGYSLDFSTVFNHAFENYKKIALYFGLIILVFSVIFFFALFSVLIAYYGVESMSKDFIENFDNQKHSAIQTLISLIVTSVISGLVAPFSAGFLKMADCADKDEEFNVSTIFTYYKTHHFSQIFAVGLIIAVISSAISTVIGNYFTEIGALCMSLLLNLIISYLTYLAIPLIIFGNLNALDALKSCLIIISKNPFIIFALVLVGFIGSFIGFFGCCIGVIFTLAFNTSMTYATYYGIFNMEEEDPIDTIGQSDLE